MAALLLRWLLRYRPPAVAPGFSLIDGDPQRRRILAAYRAAQKRLRRYRGTAETPREFAQRLGKVDWDEVTVAVEQAAYAAEPPSRSLAERVAGLVRRMKRGRKETTR